jgi:DNA-binding transcriptional regulator GbsR (MarR family)
MEITPLMQRYILHWGEMGSRWGVSRTVSQIHALLYLAPEPLNAEDISGLLNVARSNVSTSLKALQGWELVKVSHQLGDRRDYFSMSGDLWDTFTTIVDQRKRRELDPIMGLLRECERDLVADNETPVAVKTRIRDMGEFLAEMLDWYQQVVRLPKGSLKALIRMGGKIINVLPKRR